MLPVSLLPFSSVILTLSSLQNGKVIFCIFRKKQTHPHTITYIYLTFIKTFDINKHWMSFPLLITTSKTCPPKKKSTSTRHLPKWSWSNLSFWVDRWKDVVLPTDSHVILLMEEILHQLIGSLSHYLQGLFHPRWCSISSINSMCKEVSEKETKTLHVDLLRWTTKNL